MTAIALIPTRSKITFIFKGEARLEITVAAIRLELYDLKGGKGGNQSAQIRKIFARITELLRHSTLTVEELKIPKYGEELFSPFGFLFPYGYHAAVGAIVAYLRSNTEKLNIRDNAIILIPDYGEGFSLRLSAHSSVFFILRAVLLILFDKRAISRKEVKKNVGN